MDGKLDKLNILVGGQDRIGEKLDILAEGQDAMSVDQKRGLKTQEKMLNVLEKIEDKL